MKLVPAGGGAPIRLSDGFDPAFAASGGVMAFSAGLGQDSDIFVVTGDGRATRLTRTGRDLDPAFSPDGSRLVFSSRRDGNAELYAMGVDGANATRLTSTGSVDEVDPEFTPDGTRIVFARTEGDTEIASIAADGSGLKLLTSNLVHDGAPTVSPDGRTVAFASSRDHPDPAHRELYVIAADGSGARRLTLGAGADDPAFSPDGSKLAYASSTGQATGVSALDWAANPPSPPQTLVDDPAANEAAPAWQPLARPLTVTVDSRRRQPPRRLKARIRVDRAAIVNVEARARARGRAVRARPRTLSLAAGQTARVRLRFAPSDLRRMSRSDRPLRLVVQARTLFGERALTRRILRLRSGPDRPIVGSDRPVG